MAEVDQFNVRNGAKRWLRWNNRTAPVSNHTFSILMQKVKSEPSPINHGGTFAWL